MKQNFVNPRNRNNNGGGGGGMQAPDPAGGSGGQQGRNMGRNANARNINPPQQGMHNNHQGGQGYRTDRGRGGNKQGPGGMNHNNGGGQRQGSGWVTTPMLNRGNGSGDGGMEGDRGREGFDPRGGNAHAQDNSRGQGHDQMQGGGGNQAEGGDGGDGSDPEEEKHFHTRQNVFSLLTVSPSLNNDARLSKKLHRAGFRKENVDVVGHGWPKLAGADVLLARLEELKHSSSSRTRTTRDKEAFQYAASLLACPF